MAVGETEGTTFCGKIAALVLAGNDWFYYSGLFYNYTAIGTEFAIDVIIMTSSRSVKFWTFPPILTLCYSPLII